MYGVVAVYGDRGFNAAWYGGDAKLVALGHTDGPKDFNTCFYLVCILLKLSSRPF